MARNRNEVPMIPRILKAVLATAFLLVAAQTPTTALAAAAKKEEVKKEETTKEEKTTKALTPQQKKMKSCAVEWRQEKKAKQVSGRKAYNEFMKGCLKG
jgi:psiF repeat